MVLGSDEASIAVGQNIVQAVNVAFKISYRDQNLTVSVQAQSLQLLMSYNVVWFLEHTQMLGVVCWEVDNNIEYVSDKEQNRCCYGYRDQIRLISLAVAHQFKRAVLHTCKGPDCLITQGLTYVSKHPSPQWIGGNTKTLGSQMLLILNI